MLFNSLDFAIFLPIVFILYWFVVKNNIKRQNLLLVLSSYIFYGWWDWRFLVLILVSTIVDYCVGVLLGSEQEGIKRKLLLYSSILVNLGLLCYFKYFNFFIDSFVSAFSLFGMIINVNSLNIILPVGISFYTFQTLSYTIDVYRRRINPTRDFIAFSAFVCFFPQLVGGPIERAENFLPQFHKKRVFDYSKAADGLRQILWGLFKKIVIADSCSEYVNLIFNNSSDYSGSTLALGAVFFTFQIYGDFSGYSDIAIGTSRLFGFELIKNFNFPYFSRDIAEFWRRWHISLSTWFKDYLYIPLGGSRGKLWNRIRNIFIVFIISGFWHGASWNFIVWGALNAFYFLPLMLTGTNRSNLDTVAENRNYPNFKEFLLMFTTFTMTVFAWIFFRADNITHATQYIIGVFKDPVSFVSLAVYFKYKKMLTLILVFLILEWFGRNSEYGIEYLSKIKYKPVRWVSYFSVLIVIYFYGYFDEGVEFIYFQF